MARQEGDDDAELRGLSDDEKIVEEAKDRFKRAYDYESDFRKLYVQDVKFANADADNGWQWPDDLRKDREVNKRPALTINKVAQHVALITNDARQNKPSVSVKPVGEQASYEAAQVFEGIIRHIEYISTAQAIYDDASESQVEGGVAYWRVLTKYLDEDTFDQELVMEPVRDQMNVLLDCDIKEKDGSDAKWGFVFDEVPRKEFERQYPDYAKKIGSATATGLGDSDDWIRDDDIRVAEYYRIVEKEDELIYMEDEAGVASTFKRSDVPAKFRKLIEQAEKNGQPVKKRKVRTKQLQWFKIAGSEVIDRREEMKGRFIPIVRVIGKERIIEGRLERKGHVRGLKDPQRMYNYNSPLELRTPLPTPTGWTSMGAVQPGDMLLDDQGRPTRVLGVSPIKINSKCYRVEFDGAYSIVADEAHLWTVEERGKRKSATYEWQTKTIKTAELVPGKHFILTAKPLGLAGVDLPIDPYVLGVWLGDGKSAGASITAGKSDYENTRANIEACGYACAPPMKGKEYAVDFTIFGLRGRLAKAGLLGNKHIPEAYLRASKEQRIALLQGLMDTDGCISKNRQCIFINTNLAIANGVVELLSSLGIKTQRNIMAATRRMFPSGRFYECLEAARITYAADPDISSFRLDRKISRERRSSDHWRRTKRHAIAAVVEVPSVPVKCVTVDTPTHLFLAGPSMVPTHNSGQVEFGALATKSPWVGPAAAFVGNENQWNNANRTNAAYIVYNHIDEDGQPIPAPQRPEPPGTSPAFLAGMQIAAKELTMASGQEDAQFGKQGNEKSGKAIAERQRQADTITYHFTDNLALAIRYTGKILIDLIPHYYDTERVIKILGKDGTQTDVLVKPDAKVAYEEQKEENKVKAIFNPAVGKYQVEADVGPAYATQRQEAFNAFVQITSSSPGLIEDVGDLMFRSADFPLADKIAERLERRAKNERPWLFDDNAPTPQMQQMAQELQAVQGENADLLQKVAEMRLKLVGKDQMRDIDAFEADTHRITALSNAEPELKQTDQIGQLREAIRQTLIQMLGGDLTDKIDRAQTGDEQVTETPASPTEPVTPPVEQSVQ